eukprot:TRINITY_DN115068_c0_g1_i1.p1 TRINITY_DN115068_c0_g1~~TRINITY_DN115068_c0_g1_i1.p1  ORF type:complete len:146 (-),score=17.22 TRINITY_DN115068_c0_g1_i1:21-410(-)
MVNERSQDPFLERLVRHVQTRLILGKRLRATPSLKFGVVSCFEAHGRELDIAEQILADVNADLLCSFEVLEPPIGQVRCRVYSMPGSLGSAGEVASLFGGDGTSSSSETHASFTVPDVYTFQQIGRAHV